MASIPLPSPGGGPPVSRQLSGDSATRGPPGRFFTNADRVRTRSPPDPSSTASIRATLVEWPADEPASAPLYHPPECEMIPHTKFGQLRLKQFLPDADIAELEDWEYEERVWVGEAVGFSEWLRPVEDPE